jgi:predicted transposase/invertase (TIGR01784 family)
MRTDTIFYQLFQTFNTLLFELIGEPVENATGYKFTSVEVKEKAFRFDGIFYPLDQTQPIYFVEVQFQSKPDFYWDLIAEIGMYLRQYKPQHQWKAIAIFSKRIHDPGKLVQYEEFFESDRIILIYLDELTASTDSLALGIVQLVIAKPTNAINLAKKLVESAKEQEEILNLIETVLVYKFPKLTRQEIEAMFTISDLKQTRVYQDARQEGIQEGRHEGKLEKAQSLVLRQLNRRFGKLNDRLTQSIQNLAIAQIDELADQLLDFSIIDDLETWLNNQAK